MGKGKVVAIVAAACAALAIGLFLFHIHGKQADYSEALRLEEAGDTQAAYELYCQLGSYSDAEQRCGALVAADPTLPYRGAERGEIVQFGSWEQDGDTTQGSEPIKWIVLDKVDGRLLLLSESCLDARPYNSAEFQSVTWEECELRAWLNSAFLEEAFTEGERQLICEVENANDDRIGASDDDDPMSEIFADGSSWTDQKGVGGQDTLDRVFLLSETDTRIYLYDDLERGTIGMARLVDAASASDVRKSDDGFVGWWLRSPGVYSFTAQFVDENGEPYPAGAYVELDYGVRPSIWLDMRSSDDTDKVG